MTVMVINEEHNFNNVSFGAKRKDPPEGNDALVRSMWERVTNQLAFCDKAD